MAFIIHTVNCTVWLLYKFLSKQLLHVMYYYLTMTSIHWYKKSEIKKIMHTKHNYIIISSGENSMLRAKSTKKSANETYL